MEISLSPCDRPTKEREGLALNRTYIYFTVALAVKIFLSAITPLSADFLGNVLYSRRGWQLVLSSGFYAPWYAFMKAITTLWIALPMQHVNLENSIGFWYIVPNVSTATLLMMQKTPLLVFDAATAVVIGRVVTEYRSAKIARGAVLLWLINPYVTLTAEMWGTWDIVSAFFLLAAVATFMKGRFPESGICLGLGIAAKMYPLLSLPIFLMFLTREKLISSLRFTAGVLAAYLVFGAIPIMLGQGSHIAIVPTHTLPVEFSVFGGNLWGYTLDFYNVGISILVVAAFLFMFGYFLLWRPRRTSILEAIICLHMLVFAFTYWHTQYLVNLLPLLTIFYFISGSRKLPFVAYLSSALAFVLLNFAFYWTTWGHSFFFIPNYNQVLQHYSDLPLFIRQWPIGGGDVNTLITTPIRSIFVAVSLYYFAWIFLKNCDRQLLDRIQSVAFVS